MTTRILPPEEWPRLPAGETIWPLLDPARARVIAVEQEQDIVGTLTMMDVLHAECLWIAPDHRRRGAVMRHLLGAMWAQARAVQAGSIWAGSLSPEMDRILTGLGGVPVPGALYALGPKAVMPCLR